jgi:hypothetical protein
MKVCIYISFLFFLSVSIFAQNVYFKNVSHDDNNLFVTIQIESDKIIKLKENDIVEQNNEFYSPLGILYRNYFCIYNELSDKTYQLILTNWYYDEVYSFMKIYNIYGSSLACMKRIL